MKAMAAKQPSNDFHRQHQEVVQAPLIQNEFPSTDAIVLQRMSACPCGGGCPSCVGDMVIQPKLRIGEPGDRYEREADRVADDVMRMSEPRTPEKLATYRQAQGVQVQRLCIRYDEELHRQVMDEEEKTLQAKEMSSLTPQVTPSLASQINTLQDRGRPLPESMRAFFEPRFGYDFSHVRIHTDTQATRATHGLNARAFTIGHHIVFGVGQYDPARSEGRRLLAHELTHVIQQSRRNQGDTIYRDCNVNAFRVRHGIFDNFFLSFDPRLQVPMTFNITLDRGSQSTECLIGQVKSGERRKRGEVVNDSLGEHRWETFVSDSSTRWTHWWDGQRWNAANGDWETNDSYETAVFYDTPGFTGVETTDYPIYLGGIDRNGWFEFETYVKDAGTMDDVIRFTWRILINYTDPDHGSISYELRQIFPIEENAVIADYR